MKRIQHILNGLGDGAIGEGAAAILRELWEEMRADSFIRATHLTLGGQAVEGQLAVLDECLPSAFAMPQEIIPELARQRGLTIAVNSSPEDLLAIIAVPVREIVDLCDLVLADMQAHGETDTFGVDFGVSVIPRNLIVEFRNIVRTGDSAGKQQSQKRAKALSRSIGCEISFPPPQPWGQVYTTTIRFPALLPTL